MLGKLTLELKTDEKITVQKSSLFQGALMELLEPEYASFLHEEGLKPYTQNVRTKDDTVIWQITTLNQEAYRNIICPLIQDSISELDLTHSNLKVQIVKKDLQCFSRQELIEKYYFEDGKRFINLRFVTPTAFKSGGRYINYPDPALMLNSILNKYDAFSVNENVKSDEVYEQMLDAMHVVKYNLHSANFHLEGIKIPAFMGSMTIKVGGPQQLVNLAQMLFHYAQYSGIGIKTAIGMGSISIEEGERVNDR